MNGLDSCYWLRQSGDTTWLENSRKICKFQELNGPRQDSPDLYDTSVRHLSSFSTLLGNVFLSKDLKIRKCTSKNDFFRLIALLLLKICSVYAFFLFKACVFCKQTLSFSYSLLTSALVANAAGPVPKTRVKSTEFLETAADALERHPSLSFRLFSLI